MTHYTIALKKGKSDRLAFRKKGSSLNYVELKEAEYEYIGFKCDDFMRLNTQSKQSSFLIINPPNNFQRKQCFQT